MKGGHQQGPQHGSAQKCQQQRISHQVPSGPTTPSCTQRIPPLGQEFRTSGWRSNERGAARATRAALAAMIACLTGPDEVPLIGAAATS